MKSALILVISSFFLIGVFGELVSVMQGYSVTLHTDHTEIQRADTVEWRLNEVRIAKISMDSSGVISDSVSSDEASRDRLQLDRQTGDLKITNFKTTDSGQYKLKIKSTRGSSEKTFSVSVKFTADKDPVKSVSVTVGKPVTLKTEKQKNQGMKWRFGSQKTVIAELKVRADSFTVYDDVLDGIFRDRLKLDNQTGSLTITNTTNEHAGVYEAELRGSSYTIHKTFNVTVTEKVTVTVTLVLVKEGDSVTLHTDASIWRDDAVLWYGDKGVRITPLPGSVDPRWKNTVQNGQTGDLTIRNIRRDQSGDYNVNFINSSSMSIHRKFHINITGVFSDETGGVKTVSVMKGEFVFLNTSVTEIQNGDLIEWLFGPQNITIAKTDGNSNIIYNEKDVRFKNRLNLNNQTGDLTIENCNSEDSGHYQLKIINNTYTIQKSFSVTVHSGLSTASPDSGLPPAVPDSGLSSGVPDPGLLPAVPDSRLPPGAETGIVIPVLAVVAAVIYYRYKSSKPKISSEVNGQNQTSNKDDETELTEPAKAVEQQQFI